MKTITDIIGYFSTIKTKLYDNKILEIMEKEENIKEIFKKIKDEKR